MRIDISQLKEAQETVLEAIQAPDGRELDLPGIRLINPVEIKVSALKVEGSVSLKVNLKSRLSLQCSRCLKETDYPLNRGFSLDYQVEDNSDILDIEEDIRQEIVLDCPIKPLCKDTCRGLCPKCGRDLNQDSCGCV